MRNENLSEAFANLSTALIADACLRLGVPVRLAPPGIRPVLPGQRVAGRAVPVQHYGSVDVFLEAMGTADRGDVLLIDNGGRLDEGCIGDLTVLEVQGAGLAGIVLWGTHRDSPELAEIGLPVFTYGTCPAGPQRLDPPAPDALNAAGFGNQRVGRDDVVFADLDGVVFVPASQVESVLSVAQSIWAREREQASAVRAGRSLREQLQFQQFLDRRTADPSYTFRKHLRLLGGAIEE